MLTKPDFSTLPEFYAGYVKLVQDENLTDALAQSALHMINLVKSIPEERGSFRYAPEKWSVKELLCHIMDAERIFAYRALRFARNDDTELPGFDEARYAVESNAHFRTIARLAEEMTHLRASSVDLFESFTPEMLQRKGMANGNLISVVNLGYVIAGHETHHRRILIDRYLSV